MTTNPPKAPLPPPSNRERASVAGNWVGLGKWVEVFYPLMVGVVAGYVLVRAGVNRAAFDKLIKDVVPTTISIAAIFAAFQGAVHAILLSMIGTRLVRAMRRNGAYDRLIWFIREGFATLMLFVVAALVILVLISLDRFGDAASKWTAAALLGLFVWSLAASVRITMLEVKLLHQVDAPPVG